MKELKLDGIDLKDIKTSSITEDEISEMQKLSGSYESLFSRRAMKYKALGLAGKILSEDDYKRYILEEYTFLKRPVLVFEDAIVIGNSKNLLKR